MVTGRDAIEEAPPSRGLSPRRVARFLRGHLGYLVLAPLLLFAGTLVHELAHAGAALLVGGEVVDLELWPTRVPGGIRFGATYYEGSFGDLDWLVTMAPALVWTAVAALSLIWLGRWRGRLAKSLFLILFVLPLADIALQLSGLYAGRAGADYYEVLSGVPVATGAVAVVYFSGFLAAAWRRLFLPIFGRTALSPLEFGLGLVAIILATPLALVLLY